MVSNRKLPPMSFCDHTLIQRTSGKRRYYYDDDDEEEEEEEEEDQKEACNDEERLDEKDRNSDSDSDAVKNPNNGYVRRFRSAVHTKIRTGKPENLQRKKRLWNEEDEIWILKGVFEFRDEITTDFSADLGDLHELVKPYLSIRVSANQLRDKIRRLKEKYCKKAGRTEHGNDPSFSNPHERTLFSLSKKIWGTSAEVNDDQPVSRENQEDHHQEDGDEEDNEEDQGTISLSLYPRLSESLQMKEFSLVSLPVSGVDYMKEMLSYIGSSKAEEFEEKWRKLHVAETALKLMRAQLIQEQTKLILDAIK